jgi:hypothetical protein
LAVKARTGKIAMTTLAVAWSAALAAGEVYKYVDADGIMHYTNIRPAGVTDYTTFTFPCYAADPECRKVDWEQVPLNMMQLMPGTQAELEVADPFHPESNIQGGTWYLARMLAEFDGDVGLAAAAYNAGPEAVKRYAGVPPYADTREYVRRVRILYRRYRLADA